jgi:signal transduction histidine kinase
MELLEPIAERSAVQMQLIPDESSAPPLGFQADADPAQLQQVFTNIIVNAIQAMPDGGLLRIELSDHVSTDNGKSNTPTPGSFWKISFIDNGTGIAAENLAHIFEPFYTTRDVNEGTGLGLSIAYGIVQEHQGWVDVHSEVQSGSRFDVFIPKGKA